MLNWVFSDATRSTQVKYTVQPKPSDDVWPQGYWSDAAWRKALLDLEEENSITRNHAVQWDQFSRFEEFRKLRSDTLASICQRDEARLDRCKRKRAEAVVADHTDGSI